MKDKKIKKKGLVKCKYFEEMGIDTTHYYTNFCDNTDERYNRWMQERKEFGFDSRETWNIDKGVVEWIYTRFRMYLDVASDIVDLDWTQIEYRNKEGNVKCISQKKAIKKVLKWCEKNWLNKDFTDKQFFPKHIWDLIWELMPYMWW